MPSRNTIKVDVPESYYHVYARGASKQAIFIDQQDYQYFLSLFDRYLSRETRLKGGKEPYPNYREQASLLAFCLMNNHFHLMVYQKEQGGMSELMRAILTSYSRYFNRRHGRSGSLFESRYKASLIDNDVYLQHISRYIHLNPRYYKRYAYSSYHWYASSSTAGQPEWIDTRPIRQLFRSGPAYAAFCEDYVDRRDLLVTIKEHLANT